MSIYLIELQRISRGDKIRSFAGEFSNSNFALQSEERALAKKRGLSAASLRITSLFSARRSFLSLLFYFLFRPDILFDDVSQIIALLSGALSREPADNCIIACLAARPTRAITNASHVIFSFDAIMNAEMGKTCRAEIWLPIEKKKKKKTRSAFLSRRRQIIHCRRHQIFNNRANHARPDLAIIAASSSQHGQHQNCRSCPNDWSVIFYEI